MRTAIAILTFVLAAACGETSSTMEPRCGAIPPAASWGFSWAEPTPAGGATVARAVIRAGPAPCWPGGVTPGITLRAISGPGVSPNIGITHNECGSCESGCILSGGFPPDLAPGLWIFRGTMYCEAPGGGYLTYVNDADLSVVLP